MILPTPKLVNGTNHCSKPTNEPNIGLPPPEMVNESTKKKKKKRFGRRKKKVDMETSDSALNPPRFSQMENRTLSFGDNSFDADNAAYNLYAFVVRRFSTHKKKEIIRFILVLVSLWRHWWWTLCSLCEKPYQSTMVLL